MNFRGKVSVLALACAFSVEASPIYYVSNNGNDNADGLTPQTAWQSVSKVNSFALTPGSTVLFERGDVFTTSLHPTASGTAANPITFGAYGAGVKPLFSGSDAADNSKFQLVNGTSSVYSISSSQTVNSVLMNNQFYHSSYLALGQDADTTKNIDYVKSTPNSWCYNGNTLYLNTNGVNPTTASNTFSLCVRDDMVNAEEVSNLVFRDLSVTNTACYNRGYAYRIQYSSNIQVIDCDAYNAGKHHFGVLNSTGFVGNGLYSSGAMPDQGWGGASALVTFSDYRRSGDTSQWLNCTVDNMDVAYASFFTHGEGIGSLIIDNLKTSNSVGLATENPNEKVIFRNSQLINTPLSVYGNGILVDNVTITGPDGGISTTGNNNIIQHVQMIGTNPTVSYKAAIVDSGDNNTYRFNTIVMDPSSTTYASVLSLLKTNQNTHFYGNIVETNSLVLNTWYLPTTTPTGLESSMNCYLLTDPNKIAVIVKLMSYEDYVLGGYDLDSILADPKFADPANGDYSLSMVSPVIDFIKTGHLPEGWTAENLGAYSGQGWDLGAIEYSAVPEPGVLLPAGLAMGYLLNRRRRITCQA